MKHSAHFLLAVALLSGCETVQSIRNDIRDSQRPQEGAEVLQHRKLFEAGRRAEAKGDVRIAGDTYGWLIKGGSRYGEYGLAMLVLRREPGDITAVKHLVACAKRSSHASDMFPDSAMDSAFSAAAMSRLAEIAVSEHDRQDVAASLRSMVFDVVTPQVKAWAAEKKADAELAAIYGDVIAAVESVRPVREYVKEFEWTELGGILTTGKNPADGRGGGEKGGLTAVESGYTVVKFVKAQDADCRYDFEVRLSGGGTFDMTTGKVKSAIRRQLMKEFLAANPGDGAGDARISFLSWNQQDAMIKGSASVIRVSVVRVEYDAIARRGKMAVRLDGRDVPAARKWAIDNIAELAVGKNVVLVAGKAPPPGATYRTGNEHMTEDGLLEIEFSTQD